MFSPPGSNKRSIEEAIMMAWVRYLQDIEGKTNFIRVLVFLSNFPTDHSTPTPSDVMMFLTGCDSVPPLGFGDASPAVTFSDMGVLPTVSTCCLTLTFPRSFPTDFQLFKEKMDMAILGSQGFFGTV